MPEPLESSMYDRIGAAISRQRATPTGHVVLLNSRAYAQLVCEWFDGATMSDGLMPVCKAVHGVEVRENPSQREDLALVPVGTLRHA